MNKRNIVLNSTLLFVIAFLCQTTLHELGHFLAAFFLHAKDVALYHNYASYDMSTLSTRSTVVIAGAGPLVSLCIGLLFHLLCAINKKRNLFFLFMLYMSSFGYICFGGYLMITPFFQNGDTGFVCHQLGATMWLQILLAILGVGFVLLISKPLGKFFAEMGREDIMADKQQQKQFSDLLIKYPLYIGVVVATLLNLPVVAFVSLIYPLCNPLNMFWIYGYAIDKPYPTEHANNQFDLLEKIQPALIIAFILSVIANRLLVLGLHA